jgi:hypothetical protein
MGTILRNNLVNPYSQPIVKQSYCDKQFVVVKEIKIIKYSLIAVKYIDSFKMNRLKEK